MNGADFFPQTTTVLSLVVLALVSLWWLSTRRPAGLPPGPGFALPVLGHLHRLFKSDQRKLFAGWRRQYGDVFSLYLGSKLVVVLNGYTVIKKAMIKHADAFSDRPGVPLLKSLKSEGVIDSSGPLWKAQRKTTLEILREFGMGRNILAEKIQEEVQECVKALAEKKGQPLDLTRMTQVTVSNNICSIVFGKRFEYEDPFFKRYVQAVDEILKEGGSMSLARIFPVLRFVPGDPFGIRKLYEDVSTVLNTLVKPFIDRHVEEYNEDSVDDFISAYIREVGKVKESALGRFINGAYRFYLCLLFALSTSLSSNVFSI